MTDLQIYLTLVTFAAVIVVIAFDLIDMAVAAQPVFVAMMFGGTLGGNAPLIGASANIVSVGICEKHGQHVSFGRFLRYGLPITPPNLYYPLST